MNAVIRDKAALESIRPLEAAAYLRSAGWHHVKEQAGQYSVWEKPEGGESFEAVLPLNPSIRDYALRLGDLLTTLQTAEGRSQTEIYSDIQTASADVVRIRLRRAETEDGTVDLGEGVSLLENASELMLASACAAIEPRAYFAASKPDLARDYLRRLRLGQSEAGSYVIRILSPVAPSLAGGQTVMFDELEVPFERQVTQRLMRALTTLLLAANETMSRGRMEGFTASVDRGVSANLCSALVNMAGPARAAADSLAVSVSWAKSRPAGDEIPREVVFPCDRMPVIEEAARLFRAIAPREDVEIRGAVIRLQRSEHATPAAGPVTLHCYFDGQARRVNVQLGPADHATALRAYQEGAEVRCVGSLVRTGNVFTLRDPRGFAVVPEASAQDARPDPTPEDQA